MTDPRTSTALHHLSLDDTPASRLAWAVLSPDPTKRLQLPSAAIDALGSSQVHARVIDGILVLRDVESPGRRIGINRRGRLYVPVWLRRSALVVVADRCSGAVVIADVAVLHPVGERLLQAVRA